MSKTTEEMLAELEVSPDFHAFVAAYRLASIEHWHTQEQNRSLNSQLLRERARVEKLRRFVEQVSDMADYILATKKTEPATQTGESQ